MKPIQTIHLAQLLKPAGRVVLDDGSEHDVRPVTGRAFDLLQNGPATNGADAVAKLYEVVQILVPTLTREQALDLTPEQCEAVVAIASGQVDALAATLPNSTGAGTSAAPRPSSRSRGSRRTGSAP